MPPQQIICLHPRLWMRRCDDLSTSTCLWRQTIPLCTKSKHHHERERESPSTTSFDSHKRRSVSSGKFLVKCDATPRQVRDKVLYTWDFSRWNDQSNLLGEILFSSLKVLIAYLVGSSSVLTYLYTGAVSVFYSQVSAVRYCCHSSRYSSVESTTPPEVNHIREGTFLFCFKDSKCPFMSIKRNPFQA